MYYEIQAINYVTVTVGLESAVPAGWNLCLPEDVCSALDTLWEDWDYANGSFHFYEVPAHDAEYRAKATIAALQALGIC